MPGATPAVSSSRALGGWCIHGGLLAVVSAGGALGEGWRLECGGTGDPEDSVGSQATSSVGGQQMPVFGGSQRGCRAELCVTEEREAGGQGQGPGATE